MVRKFTLRWKYQFTNRRGQVMYEEDDFSSRKEAIKMAKWASKTFGFEDCDLTISQVFKEEKEGGAA